MLNVRPTTDRSYYIILAHKSQHVGLFSIFWRKKQPPLLAGTAGIY